MKITVDPHDKRIGDMTLREYDKKADLAIIGVPFDGSTRGRPGARFAPGCIRKELYSFVPFVCGENLENKKILDLGDIPTYLGSVEENKKLIYSYMKEKIAQAERFIVLGGDHSITYPSLKAFAESYGKPGLIVFDAHLDLRELVEGAVSSGTVMDEILRDKKIGLEPQNLVYIGIREFVNPIYYLHKAHKLGAKTFFAHEIENNENIDAIIEEAYKVASDGTDFVYVSFDVDSLEAMYAPGLNAPVPLGLKPNFVARALRKLRDYGAKVVDVTEVAPLYDPLGLTCRIVASIILHFI